MKSLVTLLIEQINHKSDDGIVKIMKPVPTATQHGLRGNPDGGESISLHVSVVGPGTWP